jgi:isoquinoline 1-oxidoreductase subunit beta
MNFTRRDFLKTSTIAGGGLLLGFHLPKAFAAATLHTPNAWVHIGDDNRITLLSARSEMGQGVYTSMSMLIAEELNVELAAVNVVCAPPAPVYGNALLGGAQVTGGSASVRDGWEKLRVAGAQVRLMLISAAAAKWGVDGKACRAEKGVVFGPGGKRATYGELAAAAAKLPVPENPVLKDPKDFTLVGKRTKRLDTPAKTNGTAEFGLDVKLPGMVYASLEQCPVIGGKVRSFDATKAKAMPGVIDVVQIDDGVAVVANSTWRARKAREVLTVQWEEGAGAKIDTGVMLAGLRAAQRSAKVISIKQTGEAPAMLARASRKMEAEYVSPLLAHATLEPMNFTAHVEGDKCRLIGPTQFQGAQGVVAAALGLKPENVTLQTTFLGGGFGRRFEVDFHLQAAQISKAVRKPVKLTWTREDDMTHDYYRPMSLHRLAAALDTEGMPTALTFQLTSQSVTERAFPTFAPPGQVDPFMVEAAVVPYAIPNTKYDLIRHDSGLRVGYWRSVSHAFNAFANESFIDELATASKKDPYAYRLSLLDQKPRLLAVLKQAAEKANWGQPLPAGRTRGIALLDSEGYNMCMAEVAEISVDKNGVIKVHRVVVAADIGQMVNPDTVEAQIRSGVVFGLTAALHGEITLKNGRVEQTNFNDYPMMRMNDSPLIDVVLIPSTEKPGGVGEPSTALIAPAVANALFAATGKRVRQLPLTPANIAKA